MLSTPPAFILSQDQTLNKMVSTQASRLELINFIEAQYLASKKFNSSAFPNISVRKGTLPFLVLFVRFTLFNLQGTRHFQVARPLVAFASNLISLPHPNCLVKNFFILFSTFLFWQTTFPVDRGKMDRRISVCPSVGITYLPGPSPAKYFRRG